MEKTKDAVKQQLREDWEKACNGYLVELLRMWQLDGHYGYWIGEDVGGVYDYGGDMCIGMDDIIYCVEHDVTEEEYREWSDYCVEASEFGFDTPNLKSWHMGCPRTPKETFGHLRILKKNLADAVEEEKQRMKQ
jgi:hypothetical protein